MGPEYAAMFTIAKEGLDEEDEYELYAAGTLVIAALDEGDWRARAVGVIDR